MSMRTDAILIMVSSVVYLEAGTVVASYHGSYLDWRQFSSSYRSCLKTGQQMIQQQCCCYRNTASCKACKAQVTCTPNIALCNPLCLCIAAATLFEPACSAVLTLQHTLPSFWPKLCSNTLAAAPLTWRSSAASRRSGTQRLSGLGTGG
jgi:hypothetical protein